MESSGLLICKRFAEDKQWKCHHQQLNYSIRLFSFFRCLELEIAKINGIKRLLATDKRYYEEVINYEVAKSDIE